MAARLASSARMGTSLFPEGAGAFLRKRLVEIAGLILIATGVALALALVSYTPADPSLSHATGGPVLNFMGRLGAMLADLLLQTVGLGSALIAVLCGAWGWRLLRVHRLPLWWLRVALMPIMVLLAAMAVSALPAPTGWPRPLDTGLGGVVGQLFLGGVTRNAADLGL
ncbi:MAG: cell division protein FtsK, partial [Alphaproteobacteria bacterium]|nr:cell division protein FtsK [Alphaproteobacteria bacterium]